MTESVKDIIERLRAKQLGWWKHLKSEGWHLCAICKKRPIAMEATICAFCLDAKRKNPRFQPDQPAKPAVSGKPNLRLPPRTDKEQPDDNK